jgi:hypothetical protein
MRRYEAGMSAEPAIPEIARRMRNAYWSVWNEMIRLRMPSVKKPYAKTGVGEYRSDTRPQNRRNAAKVTANEVWVSLSGHDLL